MIDTAAAQVRVKSVALPAEHGGWGFLFEPILLGLLLSVSAAGVSFALGTIGMFLARHPFKIAIVDWRRKKRYARTQLAERFVMVYGALAVLGFGIAFSLAGNTILLPIVLALPLAIVQMVYDAMGKTRALLPELSGSTALAASSACIVLAGGWRLESALTVWAVLVARSMPSVLYVRARLRLEHGGQPDVVPALVAHGIALIIVIGLAVKGLAPLLSIGMATVLLGRAAHGLSKHRRPLKARVIGFSEVGFGIATVLAFFIGYRLGI